MHRTTDGWTKVYQEKNALWFHDGNPKRPHALLTSGNHSNGFFNSKLVTDDDTLREEAVDDLVEILLVTEKFDMSTVDRVVGPATGATRLAESMSINISTRLLYPCQWASPEKDGEDQHKRMVFKETKVFPGESVLLCEDVITTGGSVDLTADAAYRAGGILLPYIIVLVNRSGFKEINNKKVVALIDRPMPIWTPSLCPLCEKGSQAIRPKGTENWARLNAIY